MHSTTVYAPKSLRQTFTKTMKAVVLDRPGGPENMQYKTDLPIPIPRSGEVLVKNDFIGINYVDMYACFL